MPDREGSLRTAGQMARVPVEGGSMRPLLRAGQSLRLQTVERPRLGDLLVVLGERGLVVHRLIARRRDGGLILRGDDTPTSDPPVSPDRVIGRVVAVEGLDGRRLDNGWQRALDLSTVAVARVQRASGHRLKRPRPRIVPRLALALERRLLPPMPVEDAMLLYLIRPALDEAGRANAVELATRLDEAAWVRLCDRALLGQVGPLAHRGLARLDGAEGVGAGIGIGVGAEAGVGVGTGVGARTEALNDPRAAVRPNLARQHLGSQLRQAKQSEILAAMLARLAEAGIEVLAHKGVALSALVYPHPALRIAGDMDLSVRDGDRERAERAVADIRDALVRENPDRRSLSGFHVELDGSAHHDLEPSLFGGGRWAARGLDWDGIWRRSRPVETEAGPMRVPDATDLLVTLLANSIRRGFSPLRLVVDVAYTLDALGDEIDWTAFRAILADSGLDRRAWIPLGLSVDWFGSHVPADVLEPPADLRIRAWERGLLRIKHQRPFFRLPSRLLWAGSRAGAGREVMRLMRGLALGRVKGGFPFRPAA